MLKWPERSDDFASRVTEDYVYIAETDHLMRYAIPNRATPNLNVAFFFPYMSPKDPKCGGVAQKWLPGLDKDDMPPVGHLARHHATPTPTPNPLPLPLP